MSILQHAKEKAESVIQQVQHFQQMLLLFNFQFYGESYSPTVTGKQLFQAT